MKKRNEVDFNSLIGEHFLSGVDFGNYRWNGHTDDSNTMLFILDGITYEATEDPGDGYRSYLESLKITNKRVKNKFSKQKVLCRWKGGNNSDDETLEFVDVLSGEVVLEVGTDHSDDYYPYCVMRWCPENLAINNKLRNKKRKNKEKNLQIMKDREDGKIIISLTGQDIGHYESVNAEWWVITDDLLQLDDLISDIKFIKKEAKKRK